LGRLASLPRGALRRCTGLLPALACYARVRFSRAAVEVEIEGGAGCIIGRPVVTTAAIEAEISRGRCQPGAEGPMLQLIAGNLAAGVLIAIEYDASGLQ
jgi:hypothetical protein